MGISFVINAVADWSGMSDLISRQALCDDLREYKVHPVPISSDESEVKGYNDGIDLAISVIAEFPSAESEHKKGKWQRRKGSDCWECSQCHAVLENDDLRRHYFYFCYHCGANMMNKIGYMDIEEVRYE